MRRTPLLVALAAIAVALTAGACQPSLDGVVIDTVSRATVVEVVDVPASVTAKAVATLTAPADGTLSSLAVVPGASVAKGTVVAVIDSPSAQKRLADAKAGLAAASAGGGTIRTADLTGAQRSLDRSAAEAFATARSAASEVSDEKVRAALVAQIDAAQRQYESAAQTSRSLAAQVEAGLGSVVRAVGALTAAQKAQAKAAYDVAAATVDALTLRAPIAGVVQYAHPTAGTVTDPLASLLGAAGVGGSVPANTGGAGQSVAGVDDVLAAGDLVTAGTAILTIVDVSELGLVGEVDETDVLLVAPGISASVELDAAPGLDFEATVGTVDLLPTASARGGVAYRVRLSLTKPAPGSDGQLPPTPRPGMSAVAHLRVRTATNAITVPAAAVFSDAGKEVVWLVKDGKAVRQQVVVGVQGQDLVQITDGLQPGQRVVVAGTDQITAGQSLS